MKKLICSLCIVLVTTILLCNLTSCTSKKKQIKNLMAEFEYACNSLDIDAMLDTITPRITDGIRLAMGLYSVIAERDMDEMYEELLDSLVHDSSISGKEFFSSLKINVEKVTIDEDLATVETTVEFNAVGQKFKRMAYFQCEYYLDKWYITGFQLN